MYKSILCCVLLLIINARSFEAKCNETKTGQMLEELRYLMRVDNIEAYIVPMSDAHQSEYLNAADKRIEFLTNFTGSGGEVLITLNEALLWTDSRYHQQADLQVELSCWKVMKAGLPGVVTIQEWLYENLQKDNSQIGVDLSLISSDKYQTYSAYVASKKHNLIGLNRNLIDEIWHDKEIPVKSNIFPLPMEFAGSTINEKIEVIRNKMNESYADFVVIPTLDSIAWLLNLRGSDITYNPVFFSYVILSKNELYLFIDEERITPNIQDHFDFHNVTVNLRKYNEILNEISQMVNVTNGKILVESPVSQAIYELIPTDRIILKDTVAQIKAIKNSVEANGMNEAHIRDAFALIRYLHWLNETIDIENVTEYTGANKLSEFRSENPYFVGLSFDVISAFGANGAMAHYKPDENTAKQITRNELYLVDSGGQYWDGTTDVTRTVHLGTPTDFEMECFTRVLKGFIALVTSVFPPTTMLSYFDYVARRPLWQVGLDYGHGTGHGVGSFLYVHEYPPSLNSQSRTFAKKNMFNSNEPGLYLDGQFGIRIEDVIQVVDSEIDNAFFGNGGLTFKTITYAPLSTKLIKTSLLNKEEAKYVNDFNKRVVDTIGPILLKQNLTETYEWLLRDTIPIVASG